jgi:hypothetical protein
LIKLINTPSWRGQIQTAGLNALSELGDARAFDVSYKFATDKSKPFTSRTAALTVVGATGKGDARAFPLIFDQFKKALGNNDFQGIFNGAQAIIKLADPRGQEAIDLLKAKFKDNPQFMGFITYLESQFQAAIKK